MYVGMYVCMSVCRYVGMCVCTFEWINGGSIDKGRRQYTQISIIALIKMLLVPAEWLSFKKLGWTD